MEMFARDEQLARWEADLPVLRDGARLDLLLPLAWQLRQRDPARARVLALEAIGLAKALPEAARRLAEARVWLIDGEAEWLFGELDAARELFRARRDLAAARYEYVQNTLRLKQAVGSLSEDDILQANSWLVPADY